MPLSRVFWILHEINARVIQPFPELLFVQVVFDLIHSKSYGKKIPKRGELVVGFGP